MIISYIPTTQSRKFGDTDDWAIATSHSDMEETNNTLIVDLKVLGDYLVKIKTDTKLYQVGSHVF